MKISVLVLSCAAALVLSLPARHACSQPNAIDVISATTDGAALTNSILGSGITVNGAPVLVSGAESAGFFTNGTSTIGLESGIILATGSVFDAEGPNILDDEDRTGDASGLGDSDLDGLLTTGFTTQDTTSLEFDFTSEGGDLFFNFVFASDEYNDFVDSEFNDVFGFFLDGANIALIPGTSTPVSINNVNGGNPFGMNASNPGLYNNNDPDDGGMFLDDFQYDGFTDVFTAAALNLSPGNHTIKLALADVGDTSVDSAVFIEASTFSDQSPANASFDGTSDSNELDVDFGSIVAGDPIEAFAAAITNFQSTSGTVSLNLDSISGAGDTGAFVLDLAPFSNLQAGESVPFTIALADSSVAGDFEAVYSLMFSGGLGGSETLTIVASANVAIPEPSTLALLALAVSVGQLRRRGSSRC